MKESKTKKLVLKRTSDLLEESLLPDSPGPTTNSDIPATRLPEIQTIERAGRLLGLFTANRSHLSLNELSAGMGLGKATTHRYAMSLRSIGVLAYNPQTALYTIGPRIVELASAAQAGLSYADIAEPYMTRLCAKVGETVVLSAWDRSDPIIVRVCVGTAREASVLMRIGTRLAKHTGHYRIWLAYGGEKVADERMKAVMDEELEQIREAGISIVTKLGLRAFACPVFQGKEIIAVISIVAIAETTPDGPDCVLAQQLKQTATEISKELTSITREL
jgi:DNA-binding IclR family transcriptional regulator